MNRPTALLCSPAPILLALLAMPIGGCGGGKQVRPDPSAAATAGAAQAEPETDAEEPPPPPRRAVEEISRETLESVLQNFFSMPPTAEQDPSLTAPTTIEDAQRVVKSDNFLLFDKADAIFDMHLTANPKDWVNLTWHAQMYLAWADSALVTEQTLGKTNDRLDEQRHNYQGMIEDTTLSKEARDKAKAKLDEIDWLRDMVARARDTLRATAVKKLVIGERKTLAILEHGPDSYRGYRLAADLYRLKEDWDSYNKAVAEIEKRNPRSNGLMFLKGVVALRRDRDLVIAERLLQTAVARDPYFSKARYYLALTYISMGKLGLAEQVLDETLRYSPGHPLAHAVRAYIQKLQKVELPI